MSMTTFEAREARLHGEALDTGMLSKLRIELGEDAVLLADLYLERLPERVASLRQAVLDGDEVRIRDTAHLLKGSSRQIGALLLGRVAEAMEKAAHPTPEAWKGMLADLEVIAERTSAALLREFDADA